MSDKRKGGGKPAPADEPILKQTSRLLVLRELDDVDEHDSSWHENFLLVEELLAHEVGARTRNSKMRTNVDERCVQDEGTKLQEQVSDGKHAQIAMGLAYGILIDSTQAAKFLQLLQLVTRGAIRSNWPKRCGAKPGGTGL